jgi:phage tail sheath gpL-like
MALTSIPSNRRMGLFQAEFSERQAAALSPLVQPAIILAQMLPSGGSATAGTRYLVATEEQAIELFGQGSPAHHMCEAFLRNAPGHELWCVAYGDESGATAGSRTLTVGTSSSATEAGTIYLYIAGRPVEVAVAVGDEEVAIAAAIAAAVEADEDLPVSAAVGGGGSEHIVTFTSKVKGTVANQITLALNPLGKEAGQVTPAGVTLTLAGPLLTSGATNTAAATWAAALGAVGYDGIVLQDTDSSLLTAITAEVDERWGYAVAKDGHVFTAKMDSSADLITFATGQLDRNLTGLGYPEGVGMLSPAYEVAAAYAGRALASLAADPGAPIQGLELKGLWAKFTPFTDSENNTLGRNGVASITTNGARVTIEYEAVTSATSSKAEDIQIPFLNSRFRRRMKNRVLTEYPRFKLAADGQPISGGQNIVTPTMARGTILGEYGVMVAAGEMQRIADFDASLVVEQSGDYSDRLDAYCEPALIDQLRVVAMRIGGA